MRARVLLDSYTLLVTAPGLLMLTAPAAFAEPVQISWWHGMGGANEQVINQVAEKFNTAQSACALTPVSKGTYEGVCCRTVLNPTLSR